MMICVNKHALQAEMTDYIKELIETQAWCSSFTLCVSISLFNLFWAHLTLIRCELISSFILSTSRFSLLTSTSCRDGSG